MKKSINFIFIFVLIYTSVCVSQGNRSTLAKKNDQRYRLALQLENTGKYLEALQIYQQLWDMNPSSMSYYRGVKNNLLNTKQYAKAILAAEKMLTIRNSYYIKADIGEIHYKLGQHEQAQNIWNDIIIQNKKNPSAYQSVANSMLSNRLYDEAIEVYQQGRKNIPENTIFLIELANLYSARIDYQNATLMYIEYLDRLPSQYSYVESQLIRLAKYIEEAEPIASIIKERIKNGKNIYTLKKLLAQLYIHDSNYGEAINVYQDIDNLMNDMASQDRSEWGRELYEFAENALRDGAYNFSEKAYRMIIAKYPNSHYIARSDFGLAESSFLQEKFQEALDAYYQITMNYPKSTEAKNSLIRIGQIQLEFFNDPKTAKEAFKKVLKSFPFSDQHFEANFYIADCDIRNGNLQAAKNRYESILKMKRVNDSVSEKVIFRVSLLNFWEQKFDESLAKLDEIINNETIIFDHRKGFFVNDALELSMLINENIDKKDVLDRYAKSMLLIEQKKYEEALKILNKIADTSPQAPLIENVLLKIGEIQKKIGQYEEAINVYRQIIKDYPDALNRDIAQKQIGDIYCWQLNNKKRAIEEYELVLINYPQSLLLEDIRSIIRTLEKR